MRDASKRTAKILTERPLAKKIIREAMQKVNEGPNFEAFRDALSTTVIVLLAPNPSKKKRAVKGRKREIKHVTQAAESMNGDLNDAAELSDFVEVRRDQTPS